MYEVECEGDVNGWVPILSRPLNWWEALAVFNRYSGGRPIRIVKVDDEGNFIREITASEILMERPD